MLNVLYIPTDKEAVEAALVLQRYCDAKLKTDVRIASTTSEAMEVVVFLTNFRVIISYQIEL